MSVFASVWQMTTRLEVGLRAFQDAERFHAVQLALEFLQRRDGLDVNGDRPAGLLLGARRGPQHLRVPLADARADADLADDARPDAGLPDARAQLVDHPIGKLPLAGCDDGRREALADVEPPAGDDVHAGAPRDGLDIRFPSSHPEGGQLHDRPAACPCEPLQFSGSELRVVEDQVAPDGSEVVFEPVHVLGADIAGRVARPRGIGRLLKREGQVGEQVLVGKRYPQLLPVDQAIDCHDCHLSTILNTAAHPLSRHGPSP